MRTPLENLQGFLTNNPDLVPAGHQVNDLMNTLESNFGYRINFFGVSDIGPDLSSLVMIAFIVLFLILNIIFAGRLARLEKKQFRFKKK